MRCSASLALPLAIVLLLAIPAQTLAQEGPPPETQRLGDWVGEWTYVIGDRSGTMKFEWFGERLVRAEEVTTNGYEVLHVMGFDPDDEVYEWHRYWNNGFVDTAKGWLHENTWTFLFDEPVGNKRRMTMAWESMDEFSFKWERSIEGGNWEVISEGRTTRVK